MNAHRFRITHEVLFPDSDQTMGVPCSVTVEADSLSEALTTAAALPFVVLMADVDREDAHPAPTLAQSSEREVEALRAAPQNDSGRIDTSWRVSSSDASTVTASEAATSLSLSAASGSEQPPTTDRPPVRTSDSGAPASASTEASTSDSDDGTTRRSPSSLTGADLRADLTATRAALAAAEAKVAAAWDEGVATTLNFARRERDGITLRLDKPNPYRAALSSTAEGDET